jgi:hypothetical protein
MYSARMVHGSGAGGGRAMTLRRHACSETSRARRKVGIMRAGADMYRYGTGSVSALAARDAGAGWAVPIVVVWWLAVRSQISRSLGGAAAKERIRQQEPREE